MLFMSRFIERSSVQAGPGFRVEGFGQDENRWKDTETSAQADQNMTSDPYE